MTSVSSWFGPQDAEFESSLDEMDFQSLPSSPGMTPPPSPSLKPLQVLGVQLEDEIDPVENAWLNCWISLTDRERLIAVCGNENFNIVPTHTVHILVAVDETTCGICQEAFDDTEVVHLKQCGHYFDVNCMDERIADGLLTCPTCSASMVTPDRSTLNSAFHSSPEWMEYNQVLELEKNDWAMVHNEDDIDIPDFAMIKLGTAYLEHPELDESCDLSEVDELSSDDTWQMAEDNFESWEFVEEQEYKYM